MKIKLLKWFGQVVQIGEVTKSRQIMDVRADGRRTRGKPKKTHGWDRRDTKKGVPKLKKIAGLGQTGGS